MEDYSTKRLSMLSIIALLGKFVYQVSDILEKAKLEYEKGMLKYCGDDVRLYPGVTIINPKAVSIGSHTHIGNNSYLMGKGTITIGEWCQVANNVIILTINHNINGSLYYGNITIADVIIENNVWIASNAIILPGVRIDVNSVVAAGAVVTKNVPANVIVAGIPARVIKQILPGKP